jgi:hypothetical protein
MMTTVYDIMNRALQRIGTRTDVTEAEYLAQSSNEAKQLSLIFDNTRDDLSRMAPWDCVFFAQNLNYITSVTGTPENTSASTNLWQRGLPMPPWAYEYQYPEDCLRACYVIPALQTGYAGGVPITTAVTGGAPSLWQGSAVKFKVATDTFYPVTAAAVVSGGSGYAVGDLIVMPLGASDEQPIGAPVILRVATVLAGVILTVTVVNQVANSDTSLGGSYFWPLTGTQDSTGGYVYRNSTAITPTSYATFTLTFGSIGSQRVILTNQEFATLAYCKRVEDPNVMDTLFQSAWISALGAGVCMAITGDKTLANKLIQDANDDIMEARKADGNEGLTVNDVTPDWIRGRGINYADGQYSGPYQGYDWGSLWPMY